VCINFSQNINNKIGQNVYLGGDFNPFGIDIDTTTKPWWMPPAKYKLGLTQLNNPRDGKYQNKQEIREL